MSDWRKVLRRRECVNGVDARLLKCWRGGHALRVSPQNDTSSPMTFARVSMIAHPPTYRLSSSATHPKRCCDTCKSLLLSLASYLVPTILARFSTTPTALLRLVRKVQLARYSPHSSNPHLQGPQCRPRTMRRRQSLRLRRLWRIRSICAPESSAEHR